MKLSFNDYDKVLEENNEEKETHAPKTIERLERISTERAIQRRMDEEEEEDSERIKIEPEDASDLLDFDTLDGGAKPERSDSLELDFEQL
jgi:hypothetical protein